MRGEACGKLILVGEHAVVYGHPAIAVPVARTTRVQIEPRPGKLTVAHDLESPRDERRLEEALAAVFPEGGVAITVESELPIGCGLGSSAALAVAIARAMGTPEAEVPELAMKLERVFHGDPSGLDVAVAARGRTLWFAKGKPMRVVPTPPCFLVVLDSGTTGDTRQLVEAVAARRPAVEEVLEDIGALVHAARAVLQDPISLGELLTENHGLLRQLGVSTPLLDQLVDIAIGAGAYGAKLSGSGGGGVVIALCADPAPLLKAASAAGFEAWVAVESDGSSDAGDWDADATTSRPAPPRE